MKNALLALFTVFASAGLVAAQFQINTPDNLIECVPSLITWINGDSPFTLVIHEPDANGHIIQEFSDLTSRSFTWSTDVSAGTTVGFSLRDRSGAEAQSAPVTILAGSSTSCIA
ncbi:uncharacterized protein PHACADRAFT_253429 [Phanerochaete carnosa HHB-10118-sp]|uniref:Uncharacterized protein n=1 Tax=Phanerochaete carnosa (strain HHB-10118-sp) TaxID=650164 RepID=K5V1J8_PHACS|nr:uncharacterized protein PHACADRAFT_253429 [Phanerochaete carnosa HHB-10118-sp]EKM56361.1 hypothetical protein PHACADRAFT_253429 [Phanerochaete carnosa HHB-10118-sp]